MQWVWWCISLLIKTLQNSLNLTVLINFCLKVKDTFRINTNSISLRLFPQKTKKCYNWLEHKVTLMYSKAWSERHSQNDIPKCFMFLHSATRRIPSSVTSAPSNSRASRWSPWLLTRSITPLERSWDRK